MGRGGAKVANVRVLLPLAHAGVVLACVVAQVFVLRADPSPGSLPDPWGWRTVTSLRHYEAPRDIDGPLLDDDAYEIYAVILRQMDEPSFPGGPRRVVYSTTDGESGREAFYPGDAPAEWKPVVRDFNMTNLSIREFQPRPPFVGRWQVRTRDEIRREMTEEGVGRLALSAVGFNPEHTRALVHVSYSCGGKCGGAGMSAFEKLNGVWREVTPAGLDLPRSVS